jgi:hypothetical protein
LIRLSDGNVSLDLFRIQKLAVAFPKVASIRTDSFGDMVSQIGLYRFQRIILPIERLQKPDENGNNRL